MSARTLAPQLSKCHSGQTLIDGSARGGYGAQMPTHHPDDEPSTVSQHAAIRLAARRRVDYLAELIRLLRALARSENADSSLADDAADELAWLVENATSVPRDSDA